MFTKKNMIVIALMAIFVFCSVSLVAGPNDTEQEEQIVKSEFTIWLNGSTLENIKYDEIDIIVEKNDDDYIREVMKEYVMPYPSGDAWYDFCIEYGFIGLE